MTILKTVIAGAAALTIGTGAAAGLIFDNANIGSIENSIAVSSTGSPSSTVTYRWNVTPTSMWLSFSSDTGFAIDFTSFTSNGGMSDVTGLILDILDGPDGNATTRLTNDTAFCASAAPTIAGNCDLFALTGANGGNAVGAAKPGDTLFTGLTAGSYRLGIYDSATPDMAAAAFTYREELDVSAPGALALLGLGFLGVAAARARK